MDAQNHGMNLRFSYAPYPLVGRPREVLRRYVEGNDPVTGKPLMPQIVDALTKPLTEEERNPKAARGAPRPGLHEARQRGEPAPALPGERLDRRSTHRSANRGTRRPHADRDRRRPERGRRPDDRDHPSGEAGIHGGEGGRERGHGGRRSRTPAGHPGVGGERRALNAEFHDVVRQDGGRQRTDPRRDRHELRPGRPEPLQPCQYRHRAGLDPDDASTWPTRGRATLSWDPPATT